MASSRLMQRLLFMHIHKTAGTALAKQLFGALPSHAICPARFEWQLATCEDLTQYQVFHGHISAGALRGLEPLTKFTVLREPRIRLLSAFFFWSGVARRRIADNAFFRRICGMKLIEFLQCTDDLVWQATWNVQARLLAGGRYGANDDQRTSVRGPCGDSKCIVERALRGLGSFALVGLAERYEETLQRAGALVGVAPPPPERHNIGANGPDRYAELLADRTIARALDRLTEADRVVYEAAAMRFGPSVGFNSLAI